MKIDKIIIINLPERKDRKANMRERLKDVNIPTTFFRASGTEYQEQLQEMNDYGLKNKSNLNPGALGCWLSHYRVWSTLKTVMEEFENVEENILVLEDDCVFDDNWMEEINNLQLPEYWDLIHLGVDKKLKAGKRRLHQPEEWLSHSYIVNYQGINKLLKKKTITHAIDHHIHLQQGEMQIYDIRPRLTWQDNSKSDIQA